MPQVLMQLRTAIGIPGVSRVDVPSMRTAWPRHYMKHQAMMAVQNLAAICSLKGSEDGLQIFLLQEHAAITHKLSFDVQVCLTTQKPRVSSMTHLQ